MSKNKLKWASLIFLFMGASITNAQEAFSSASGNADGSGGTSSYTVGQVAYSYASNEGSVTQGVQQVYEITTVLGMELTNITLDVSIYPNPTTDYLTLKIETDEQSPNQDLNYHLYNMEGKLVEHKKITGGTTTVDMKELRTSTYLLKVTTSQTTLKTFRIIKN